jgi:hypothetical protein
MFLLMGYKFVNQVEDLNTQNGFGVNCAHWVVMMYTWIEYSYIAWIAVYNKDGVIVDLER